MYANEKDLLTRFQGGTAQAGDEANALALADASDLINTYLSKKYVLPFETVPSILKKLCVDLACYFLANADEFATEDIRKRYDDALGTLKDIAKGIIELPISKNNIGDGTGDEIGTNTESGAVLILGPRRVFGRDKGF